MFKQWTNGSNITDWEETFNLHGCVEEPTKEQSLMGDVGLPCGKELCTKLG
eukprot:CAMPEP_0113720838 /NCGR_PEP_ID=MMETSP0038_2-20120614/36738_1 /TAXON_ID=2898 /ORGANISM="Cryptomonas paramecium" /LENGTH=50 /DNA_ID=CAMNT_0000649657 /DNA_START=153 /DNA_END=302 /DNA_ORIENTATION=+ /assembly_acc=CAM_ASM_000170